MHLMPTDMRCSIHANISTRRIRWSTEIMDILENSISIARDITR
jgi:hypothetical protein